MKKLTGYAVSEVQEGVMVTYTYSEINEQGIIIRNNERESRIIIDDELKDNVKKIQDFIKTHYIGI
ncbi:MAG: hypothetical protein RR942_14565 [Romboutsia sp.]